MELVLKLAVCLLAVAGLSQVQGQAVICYSGSSCTGTDLGVMPPRDCCVSNAAGNSFRPPTSEVCSPCIVYGFSQETLTAVEQDTVYAVPVGYWKGADLSGLDFTLDVSSKDGTANEGANLDYTVATTQVEVAASAAPSEFNDVEFSLNIDGDFLEDNETFSIQLTAIAGSTIPTGDGAFFLDTLNVTIVDSDAIPVNISFANEAFSAVEGTGFVEVCFGTSGANAEPFNVTVLTVMKEGVDSPATENTDFFAVEEQFTFDASEGATIVCFDIDIDDDSVYEGDEQFLVMFGDISSDLVDVGPISQACVTIIDDDEPTVSLTPLGITVGEGDTSAVVCINFDGLIDSPFIFTVVVEPSLNTEGFNQATADIDFNSTAIVEEFTVSTEVRQVRCFPVPVIDDDVSNEPEEQFSLVITDVSPVGRISDGEIRITIIDNDMPQISIAPTSITVQESISEVEVCITIAGGMLEGRVVVTAETDSKDGAIIQATAGLDYEATTIEVSFEPSDAVSQTVCASVSIINDTFSETDEVFAIRLVSAVPIGNFVQDEDEVCVTITDDDTLICHENAEIVEGIEGETFCVCLPGFTGDGVTNCDDINECATIDDVCADFVNCINVDGSFECECRQEDGTYCTTREADVKSTRTRSRSHTDTRSRGSGSGRSKRSRSSRSSRCTPKKRARNMCGCGDGYFFDDMTCKDIDECETGENDCNDRVQCINEPGSYRCVCDCLSLTPMTDMPTRSRTSRRRTKSKSKTKTTKGPKTKSTRGPRTKSTPGPKSKSTTGSGTKSRPVPGR